METYLQNQTDEELQLILTDTEGCESFFFGMIRCVVQQEVNRREKERLEEEERNKPKDKYNEMLYKLYLKGIIDEEQLEEKMEQREKQTEFETNVNKAILEIMEEGYIKKTIERIFKEKNK